MVIQKISRKYVLIIGLVILIAAALFPSLYFYRKYQTLQKQVNATEIKDDIPALTARVGKHILLPDGEVPTVMTVTDKEKLSGQLFFANAKDGDKVLIYEKAKKAFLYNPAADRIIEVGPVALSSPVPSVSPVASPSGQASTSSAVPRR